MDKLLKCHLKEKLVGNWEMDRILITLRKNGTRASSAPILGLFSKKIQTCLLVYTADLR